MNAPHLRRPSLLEHYRTVRKRTESLCAPLATEDHVPQPVPDVSPPKWHLGHVTWFFETFVLCPHLQGYEVFDERYGFLFNSYYDTVGDRVPRARRGTLSRPTVTEIMNYRAHVDAAMEVLLGHPCEETAATLCELGLQHEQQHQELLVTDIKAILACNPLAPSYDPDSLGELDVEGEHAVESGESRWVAWPGGTCAIGDNGASFAFDNERPRHETIVPPVELRTALVTNGEYLEFIADGGYQRFEFWHAEGWDWVRTNGVRAPDYWMSDSSGASHRDHYTLAGIRLVDPLAPLTHVNYYEASAFCQWAGWRLPTEFEWEALASLLPWGRRWEWTASAYLPYPGFSKAPGAVGEYNGKFMVNQMTLRGASFATPPGHARSTYRNFFHPHLRWQYTGIRPARDPGAASR